MNKVILLLITFLLCGRLFGQTNSERVLYVVDSTPIIDDPEEGDTLSQNDVSDVNVVTNSDTLKLLKYDQFDKVIYIFTKEYRGRDEALRKIPSSKQMKKENETWILNGNSYTGPFIDYYLNGKKHGYGKFINGQIDGLNVIYYPNGNKAFEIYYKNGVKDGNEKTYYSDGSLKEDGNYANGKEEGAWESYYPNGQIKLKNNYKNGELVDSAFRYYSNGKIKDKVFINNGKVIPDPAFERINQLMQESEKSDKDGNTKAAIKYCMEVIALDSTYSDAYFSKATLELNDFQFDNSINDYDKALQIEPYLEAAFSNRAFARIRKYQFGSSRVLSENDEVTVLASKDKVSIPEEDKEKICNDLQKAVFLGDKSKMITEALANYCQQNN